MTKQKPTIKITPTTYRGFDLSYNENADGINSGFIVATKGRQRLSSNTVGGVIREIENAEKLTVRFKEPIKCQMLDYSSWEKIEVHSVVGDCGYYRKASGEEGVFFLQNIKIDRDDPRPLIVHDTQENRDKINEVYRLRKEAADLNTQADKLKKTYRRLSEADLALHAKA